MDRSQYDAVVMDIQCFKGNENSLIIKEVTIIDVETSNLLLHHIVCPPFSRLSLSPAKLRESLWLTNYFHGLEWSQGDIPYHSMLDKIKVCLSNTSTVYVKGLQKQEFLQNIVPLHCKVQDLESMGCQSLGSLTDLFDIDLVRCKHHKTSDHRCALSVALALRKWYVLTQK